ncbi:MAG: NAD(+) diphosphatase, partial [Dehalococcoidia bacterium]|nr:NAD(+) diphosphatase [Dehalococcoidia bacterium]
PKWIEATARKHGTRILPLWKLNVLMDRGAVVAQDAARGPSTGSGRADGGSANSGGSTPHAALGWVGPELLGHLPPGVPAPILLGLRDGVAHFAVDISNVQDPAALGLPDGWKFEEARAAAMDLPTVETGIIAQSRAQADWHNRHRFCSVCGERTQPERGGLQRRCTACKAEHFPRTDPVVIMLVHNGDRALLGQTRARMSSGFYSCLAGFMDQGESIEEAVRREVREESGLEIKDVRYHSSQPWPFPSSLMIGCHATAVTDKINFETEEMSDVRWYTRAEVAAALENKNPDLKVPGPIAIAHHLIKAWVTGEVK